MTFLFLMLCPSAYALTHAQPHVRELERAEMQNNIENYARARVHPPPSPLTRRASIPAVGFYNPTGNGGSWLTVSDERFVQSMCADGGYDVPFTRAACWVCRK